ncbi:acyltransferase 3 [Cladochytrium replicatum]|nr:acyltransferase 3 [Cladochytrium replicatum]
MMPSAQPHVTASDRLKAGKPRTFYIDNLRTFLTFIVIVHHTLYSLVTGWDPLPAYPYGDLATIVVYVCFCSANQAYFMSLFFFLAGLFVQRSLERKGTLAFLVDRGLRLVLPIVVVYLFFSPMSFYLCVIAGRVPEIPAATPGSEIWRIYFSTFRLSHTWFLYNLFLFCSIFSGIFQIPPVKRALTTPPSKTQPLSHLATFLILLSCFAIVFPIIFAFRIAFPIGVWIPALGQLAYLLAYVLFFSAGIGFQHRKIVDRIPINAYLWLLPVMTLTYSGLFGFRGYMLLTDGYLSTLGGVSWQAALDSFLEILFMVFTSAFLVTFFRRFANNPPSAWWKRINEASYTVYLIQQIVILPATVIVYYIPVHPLVLWIISSVISVPVVWLLAMAIKLIPKIDRIL